MGDTEVLSDAPRGTEASWTGFWSKGIWSPTASMATKKNREEAQEGVPAGQQGAGTGLAGGLAGDGRSAGRQPGEPGRGGLEGPGPRPPAAASRDCGKALRGCFCLWGSPPPSEIADEVIPSSQEKTNRKQRPLSRSRTEAGTERVR